MTAALPAFDTLLEMARHDPEGLERLRRRLCEQIIERNADARRQHRLRGLLWRIDHERQRARTPLAACLRLHSLMLDAVFQLNSAFNDPRPDTATTTATVLPFTGR
jgi:type VI protein secretion system component VasF